jgi:integrase
VYARLLAGGATVYDAVAKVHGKQRWSRGHRTLGEARAARDEMRVAMRRGQLGTAPARLTLEEYIDKRWWPYAENELRSDESRRSYRSQLQHVRRLLGKARLAALTPIDIETFKADMRRQGVGEAMQNAAYDRLRQMLNAAVKWELIWRNPCQHVTAPREPEHEAPELTVEDVKGLLRAADETTGYGTLFYAVALTGMRWGELTAWEWSHIDFATGVTRILRENTKTKAGKRPIKLGPELLARLQQHRLAEMKRFNDAGLTAPRFVFSTQRGSQLKQANFHRQVWGPLRDRLGLPEMHFHDLRHVNSTLMARTGAHPSLIQRRMGHSDARLSQEVYTDLHVEDQDALAEGLEAMLR